jgi:hypothetical protein
VTGRPNVQSIHCTTLVSTSYDVLPTEATCTPQSATISINLRVGGVDSFPQKSMSLVSSTTAESSSANTLREFHGVEWRLDIPIASRTSADAHGAGPTVELQFTLAASAAAAAAARLDGGEAEASVSSSSLLGLVGPSATSVLEREWVSLDYEALLKLTQAVESAAAALDSAGYRRMQRLVK